MAVSVRAFQSEDTKARRSELKRQKELRALAERISTYGRIVQKQLPTGVMVVGERDLAQQLPKRTQMVAEYVLY